MEIFKHFKICGLHVYVSNFMMKRRNGGLQQSVRDRNRKRVAKIRKVLWRASGGCCEECGASVPFDETEIHHIIPISENPSLAVSMRNMRVVCKSCHARLHEKKGGEA